MMTREEASRHLHNDWYIENGHLCVYENARDLFLEAVGMGIKALRPISREQVEKMWRGEWERITDPYGKLEGFLCKCGTQTYSASNFCPHCGGAMTDEAVEMVMERLEEVFQ